MAPIVFPQSHAPGDQPQQSAGELYNCFPVPRGNGLPNLWHRVPGTVLLSTADGVPTPFPGLFRGGAEVAETEQFYGIFGDALLLLNRDGTIVSTAPEPVPGTAVADIAINNHKPTAQVAIIIPGSGAFQVDDGVFEAYQDPNIIDPDAGAPVSCCFHEGYFIFGYSNGLVRSSDLNDLTINAANFASAESNSDGLSRVWSHRGQLYLGGPKTIEVWGAPINPSGFPFTRVGYNITPGLFGRLSIAGFEPEWGQNPVYVGSDRTVRQLEGYTANPISSPQLTRLIQLVSVEDQENLIACVYDTGGHSFWQVSYRPNGLASDGWTWVYETNVQAWHERKSWPNQNCRFAISAPWARAWWTDDNLSAYESQPRYHLMQISDNAHSELQRFNFEDPNNIKLIDVGEKLRMTLISLDTAPRHFPQRIEVPAAEIYCETGVGELGGLNADIRRPNIELSWSNDGGGTFSVPWVRELGRGGEKFLRVRVFNTGLTGPIGRRWRLDISDPVEVAIMGGAQTEIVRGA